MADPSERKLTAYDAAKILFRCVRPAPGQVEQVVQWMDAGVLGSSRAPRAGASRVTSAADIAEFLASKSLESQQRRRTGEVTTVRSDWGTAYQQVLRDYFLAVLARRNVRGRSRFFQRAVIAGQIGGIFLLGVIVWSAIRLARPPLSPEQAAVWTWVEENFHSAKLLRWHPPSDSPENGARRVRVEFRYFASQRKSVDTTRLFEVQNGTVREVHESDE